jgi:hypothetical protein
MWTKRWRSVRTGYYVASAAIFLTMGAIKSTSNSLAVGAVAAGGCLVLGVFEWFRPARGPRHPPNESTIQRLHKQHQKRKDT